MKYLHIKQFTDNKKCDAVMTFKDVSVIEEMLNTPKGDVEQFIIDEILTEAEVSYCNYDDDDFIDAVYFTTEIWIKDTEDYKVDELFYSFDINI